MQSTYSLLNYRKYHLKFGQMTCLPTFFYIYVKQILVAKQHQHVIQKIYVHVFSLRSIIAMEVNVNGIQKEYLLFLADQK